MSAVILQGYKDDLYKPLRAELPGMKREHQDALVEAFLRRLPEVEAPPVEETHKGIYKEHDGSGYLIVHESEHAWWKLVGRLGGAFYSVFSGFDWDILGFGDAGGDVVSLGKRLFDLRRDGVMVDPLVGQVLKTLKAEKAGLTVAELVERAPAHLELTPEVTLDILVAAQTMLRGSGQPTALVEQEGEVWRTRDI